MTTFSAPFTMPRYLDAAARDLRGYFYRGHRHRC